MYLRDNWTTLYSLKLYTDWALSAPDDFLLRFNWKKRSDRDEDADTGFTLDEVDAIYAEIIAKIPAGATKVLELGCGDGRFAAALRAAKPTLGYRGIDLVPDNIDAARVALPAEDFEVGNLWEYLAATTVDWDFIVSINCAFHSTETRADDDLFGLIDAKAPKGFFILTWATRPSPARVVAKMAEVVAASTAVSEQYIAGARDFLTDATLKGHFTPFYVHRDSTATEAPELPRRCCIVQKGQYNAILAQVVTKRALLAGDPEPTQIKGIASTGGLITSVTPDLAVDPEWTRHMLRPGTVG